MQSIDAVVLHTQLNERRGVEDLVVVLVLPVLALANLVVLRKGKRSLAVRQKLVLAQLSAPLLYSGCISAARALERSEGLPARDARREMRKGAHVAVCLHLALDGLLAIREHLLGAGHGRRRVRMLLIGFFPA
eukprot:1162492-Pleurochrysis_carterae.AAC.2